MRSRLYPFKKRYADTGTSYSVLLFAVRLSSLALFGIFVFFEELADFINDLRQRLYRLADGR